jgi:hypothetical protein
VDELFARPVLDAVAVASNGDPAVRITGRVYPGLTAVTGVRVSDDGQTWSDWLDPAALDPEGEGLAWRLADGPDGPRTVHLELGDEAGTLSVPAVVTTTVDRLPPTIEGPSLRPAPVPGGWTLLLTARDAGGVGAIDVRWRVGARDFGDWRPLDSLAAASVTAPVDQPVEVEVSVTDVVGHEVTASALAPAGSWTPP